MASTKAGRTRWRIVTAITAVPLGLTGLLMAWFITDSAGHEEPTDISCAAAMTFAHGTLPTGTTNEHCQSFYWQETEVNGTFHMPRADVEPWLSATYPQFEPDADCAEDRCLTYAFGTSDLADTVKLSIRFEPGTSARITLLARQS
ncbi:hypothetical protein [Streptomyces sp. H39-S7]|uniref:hypothetical protein n=1 Tax=Streptomyces sp. H39-S7 TaxID=3004357 RepID=UPI0022B05E24|nr:hypothetical protein [Streptomyces sp. H39-S7]MCZ4118993.1 hypothetical protein [Streptomyces sp. H39-S7]